MWSFGGNFVEFLMNRILGSIKLRIRESAVV